MSSVALSFGEELVAIPNHPDRSKPSSFLVRPGRRCFT